MQPLDVTPPENRKERILDVSGFGWMAVVWADFSCNASVGLLHEPCAGRPNLCGGGSVNDLFGDFGVRRSGQLCGRTLKECTASMRADDLAFCYVVACVTRSRDN